MAEERFWFRTLQKFGNSYALVFDQSMMDALGITPDTPLRLSIVAGAIFIEKAKDGDADVLQLQRDETTAKTAREQTP